MDAQQLSTQRERSEKVRVRRRYIVFPVLNQVIRREGILRGDVIVQTGQTEIFPNFLDRISETCRQTSAQHRTIRRRPEAPRIRQHALLQTRHWNWRPEGVAGRRQQTQSRTGVGHETEAADSQPLPEHLVISEQKELIPL